MNYHFFNYPAAAWVMANGENISVEVGRFLPSIKPIGKVAYPIDAAFQKGFKYAPLSTTSPC